MWSNDMPSYYETLAKTIRTPLYPNGVKIDLMQEEARRAEFRKEVAKKRKKVEVK